MAHTHKDRRNKQTTSRSSRFETLAKRPMTQSARRRYAILELKARDARRDLELAEPLDDVVLVTARQRRYQMDRVEYQADRWHEEVYDCGESWDDVAW